MKRFTLIELLVVLAIIGILGSLIAGGMGSCRGIQRQSETDKQSQEIIVDEE